ncbi:hypothetical protein ABZ671_00815 [Micromonospora sp. NPDC006766]|uniref:hypothetical protein n=1 Tax=Micromonospora sp. NPDC006766 TaxID=3154778 RepID=UPI0033D6B7B4
MGARTIYSTSNPPPVAKLAPGQWRTIYGSIPGQASYPSGTERASLMFLPAGLRLQAMAVWCAAAAQTLRFGIRADENRGAGTLLLDTGPLPATGVVIAAIDFVVPPGPITGTPLWLSVTPQGAAVTMATVNVASEWRDAPTAQLVVGVRGCQAQAAGQGPLPTTFVTTSNVGGGAPIAVQAAN